MTNVPGQSAEAPGSLEQFAAAARSWLAANSPNKVTLRDPHDVAVFHNLSHEEEHQILDRLRDWQRQKFEAGYGAISWSTELHGAGLGAGHADAFKAAESE